ncbi:Uma2 family endonuclease [uncultured Robinsoniella sp.]|uniref:Uma2 family endonuclease n=1 Tax=uncultured Robinsoniella sp. TaxID=904190 RepID=UPI00374F8CE8
MPLPKEQHYTIDDIYNLPEGTRAELIDGQIYYMAPPSRQHQQIVLSLSRKIADYIDSHKGPCEVDIAPFAVFLNEDDTNYIEPDISVICSPDKLTDKGCNGAPDWIIEIVSPGSRRMDYYTKLFKYRTAGVREYWIVDASKNLITVYDFEHDDVGQYSFSDTIKAGIYNDLYLDFSGMNI